MGEAACPTGLEYGYPLYEFGCTLRKRLEKKVNFVFKVVHRSFFLSGRDEVDALRGNLPEILAAARKAALFLEEGNDGSQDETIRQLARSCWSKYCAMPSKKEQLPSLGSVFAKDSSVVDNQSSTTVASRADDVFANENEGEVFDVAPISKGVEATAGSPLHARREMGLKAASVFRIVHVMDLESLTQT